MYGHASDPSRVYAYGAQPPRGEDGDLIRAQIDAGWRYRNDLVALELDRRERVGEVVRAHYPDVADQDAAIEETEAEIEDARAAIRAANQRKRARDPGPGRARTIREMRDRLANLRREHRAARKRAYADDAVQADLAVVDTGARTEQKRLRAESGLHWGSYLAVEQSLSGIRSGAPPRFARRATWGGQVAVQVQGGATWEELMEGHGQFRVEVEPLPPNATPGGRRSKRPYCRAYFRVGSEGPGNRTPVWAMVRFVLHRPIPEDGRVKWARLTRQRVGTDEKWQVQFVVAREEWVHHDTGDASGVCGVDLGWRTLDDGSLRVAYAMGEDGESEELVIPAERVGALDKADSLRAIRDREFDLIRAQLEHWLATEPDLPEWLAEDTRTLGQWRAQARLAAVVIRWRDQRFEGDDDIYESIEAWRKQDKHVYDWEGASRAKFQRWRKQHYERFAARLRWRYETVIVEDADWAQMARTPPAEDHDEPERLNRRRMARIASPGYLREALEHGHPDVRRAPSANTTRTCSVCGCDPAGDWDPITELDYRCEAGHVMDQDCNAAINLMHASGDVVRE